jgi:hypothetical protein
VASEQWQVASDKWQVANGKWRVSSGSNGKPKFGLLFQIWPNLVQSEFWARKEIHANT